MKTSHRCPKCQCGRILYIATVADRYGEHLNQDASVPMKIAHYTKDAGRLFGMAVSRTERAGELEAGVCPQCGYTELYTKDPGNIIVDGTNVRELVAPDG